MVFVSPADDDGEHGADDDAEPHLDGPREGGRQHDEPGKPSGEAEGHGRLRTGTGPEGAPRPILLMAPHLANGPMMPAEEAGESIHGGFLLPDVTTANWAYVRMMKE